MGAPGREAVEERDLQLVREALPARADADGWVVRLPHDCMRIVLDHAVGGCWYDHLDRSGPPACRRLDDDRLAVAVRLAEALLAADPLAVAEADARSLAWRGMRPTPGHAPDDVGSRRA